MVDRVDDALIEVNRALLAEASTRGEDTTIGSTVVVVLACGRHCACLWAGDSRIYRLRDGRLRQISQDHSQVMDMVEQGLILRPTWSRVPWAPRKNCSWMSRSRN